MIRVRPIVAAAILALLAACGREEAKDRPSEAPAELFVDVTAESGVQFTHSNGMTGQLYYPEVIGSGVAVLDYDNDGRPDILVLQGGRLADKPDPADTACTARLYHNETAQNPSGPAKVAFTDATSASKLCAKGYGMGIAVGDVDNDGFVDVFITHFGAPNQLFRNNGDGTFTDITDKAGLRGNGEWSTSASFADLDHDGYLDLFVTNYVHYSIAENKRCTASTSLPDYCAPTSYKPIPSLLYRNRGDGTFEDITAKSGITAVYGAGLGVIATDMNEDGWVDFYVANDANPNQLWINQKNGTFKDEAPLRGSSVNMDGAAEAGMGVDIGDFDGNGTDDIFLTHLRREKNTLFLNRGNGQFEDRSVETGLAQPSIPYTGFGTAFLDYDNDGWLDIVTVNGAVSFLEDLRAKGDPYPLHQKKQLFHNLGNGKFEETTDRAGKAFQLSEIGRGLAAVDLDNDGRVDFVVSNNSGPLRIFMNRVPTTNAWFGVRLVSGKRDAYNARIEVVRAGQPTIWRRVRADGSYLSANDPRVVIGLGSRSQVDRVIVHWPDGAKESFATPPLGRYTTLTQGTGQKS